MGQLFIDDILKFLKANLRYNLVFSKIILVGWMARSFSYSIMVSLIRDSFKIGIARFRQDDCHLTALRR